MLKDIAWRVLDPCNKLEFKRHPQRIPKPIIDQNLFSRFHSICSIVYRNRVKRSSHSGGILCKKINLISRENFWVKMQEPDW